jgi:hypothetical protein
MKKGFFIQANKKQLLGALIAKYAFEKTYGGENPVLVTIMLVEEIPEFKKFAGSKYYRKEFVFNADPSDLQFFTLTRFLPPQLMSFEGRAIVIDPDIFALQDISPLFEIDLGQAAIAACRKKEAWDSSLMVLDCAKLKHWKISEWLEKLTNKRMDYDRIMMLKDEKNVTEIPRIWNDLDHLDENTKMLHTTMRLTQPWKTGLPRDFTINPLPKYFGIIPREPIFKILGKYPTHYQPHPNKKIEQFFFELLRQALSEGYIERSFLHSEIAAGHVRKDLFEKL